MLERFHDSGAQEIAERVAKACLVASLLESNLEAAVEIARKSVADPDHWVMDYSKMTRGLAEYRSGNYQGAQDWCQKALEQPVTWHVEANACLVLAMSEFRLGQTQGVRRALDRAAVILEAAAANFTSGSLGKDWHDWLFSEALQEEAEAIIGRQQTVP
jgi:hypothetical protein